MSYLSEQVSIQGSTKVMIPFDRQRLADYLNLDRSALSKELGKMKKNGLLDYHKNVFDLKIGRDHLSRSISIREKKLWNLKSKWGQHS